MNKKGFTLVEVLLVIVLIAIIAIIALPNIMNALKSSKNEGGKALEQILQKDLELYNETNKEDLWANKNATNVCISVPWEELKSVNSEINLGNCRLYKHDGIEPLVVKKVGVNKFEYYANIICSSQFTDKDQIFVEAGSFNTNDVSYETEKSYGTCEWQDEAKSYNVSVEVDGGSVDGDSTKTVNAFESATFKINLGDDKEKYVTCDNEQTANLKTTNDGSVLVVNTVSADTVCTVASTSVAECPSSITGYSDVYDGNAHGVTVSSESPDELGGVVEYSADGESWQQQLTYTKAGNYNVHVRVRGDAAHSNKICSVEPIPVNITRRDVVVRANDVAVERGKTPAFSYKVDNLIGSDNLLDKAPIYTVKNSSGTVVSDVTAAAVGTYSITISLAGDTETNPNYKITAFQPGTLTVNKKTCDMPQSLSVSTGGIVTWSNSSTSDCNKYKVSLDGRNWTENVSSGYNMLSTLTGSSGSKTVYLKAYSANSGTFADSSAATATVSVLPILFESNNNSFGTVNKASINVISGASLSSSGNSIVIKGVTTGSNTINLVTVTPTPNTGYKFVSWSRTSGSLTSPATLTANFESDIRYTVKYDPNGGTKDLFTENDYLYPWVNIGNVWKSGNYHIDSSTSTLTTKEFTLSSTDTLSFEWAVASENQVNDFLYYTIYKNGQAMEDTGMATAIGGNRTVRDEANLTYSTVTKSLSPGTYKVSFTYYKDSDDSKGLDRGYVKNFTLANTNITEMPDTMFVIEESKPLTKNIFTKNHYSFLGWSTSSSATTPTYSDGQTVKNLATTNNAVVNLYAIWKPLDYTVNVVVQEGTVDVASKIVTYNNNATFTVTPNEPGRGYVSCTNGQSGSISGSTLTIRNVGSNTTCTVSFSTIVTTLFEDGTLMINESLGAREPNIAAFGEVVAEYEALSNRNVYVFGDPSAQLWAFERDSVKKIYLGNSIAPVSTAYWFSDLTNMSTAYLSILNTSNVTDMNYMFNNTGTSASTYELDGLETWDISNVKSMNNMFAGAAYSATNINIGNISGWNTSKVISMNSMFNGFAHTTSSFTMLNLAGWDVSRVQDMGNMFYEAGYNASNWTVGNLSSWITESVASMNSMFYQAGLRATSWTVGDLSGWDVSHVQDMESMFFGACNSATTCSFGTLANWNVSNVQSMKSMFAYTAENASSFTLNLSSWNVANVTTMEAMLRQSGFKSSSWNVGYLTSWNTSNVTNMSGMFDNAGHDANTWGSIGTLKVYADDIHNMFKDCTNAKATVNLYTNSSNYDDALSNASTVSGSLITINYSNIVSNIDNIIATKGSSSNIVKGTILG